MRLLIKKKRIITIVGCCVFILFIFILSQSNPNENGSESVWKSYLKIGDNKENEQHKINVAAPNQKVHEDLPGDMGKAVIIKKESLNEDQKKRYDAGYQNNAFNEYASNLISVNRRLPDKRDKECFNYVYKKKLPTTSVIVIFHNEAWSVLLRSVHSIINRSPKHLLKEIILVDDASTMSHLYKPLNDYMDQLKIVKIVRSPERHGLIRARLMGAEVATGEVLTFLDSHIECTDGWLEPLLSPIAEDWRNVTVPVIDIINLDTFEFLYSTADQVQVGGFSWSLIFNWHVIPPRDKIGRKAADPVITPTMAGGLFSISKKFFDYLGRYDPGFEIWGGENLELSFKAWMCGGIMKIIPCSHVGHVFRNRSPYSWGTTNVLKKNLVRLAMVWLDEYKDFYFMRLQNNLGDYGDISERLALRKSLKCHNFKWYLDNIFPDLFVPSDAIYSGEIRNQARAYCVDGNVEDKINHNIIAYICHNQGGNQFWMMSKKGEIRRDDRCIDFDSKNLISYECHGGLGNQHWHYMKNKQIRHMSHNMCLELNDQNKLIMAACNDKKLSQKWDFPVYVKKIMDNSE